MSSINTEANPMCCGRDIDLAMRMVCLARNALCRVASVVDASALCDTVLSAAGCSIAANRECSMIHYIVIVLATLCDVSLVEQARCVSHVSIASALYAAVGS